jgi:hypothetical protein
MDKGFRGRTRLRRGRCAGGGERPACGRGSEGLGHEPRPQLAPAFPRLRRRRRARGGPGAHRSGPPRTTPGGHPRGRDALGRDEDPLQAIDDVVRTHAVNEIVLVVNEANQENFRERDLAGKARARFACPVHEVVVH